MPRRREASRRAGSRDRLRLRRRTFPRRPPCAVNRSAATLRRRTISMADNAGAEQTSRLALRALLGAMFVVSLGYGIVLPILPFLVEKLAGSADPSTVARHTGFLTATYALGLTAMATTWGRISDRLGRRPPLLIGLVGFAAALAAFAL